MKKIVLILVVIILFSCKKKETAPVEPEPVCTIVADDFSGKYFNANNDTIIISFLHNNCPTNKSNTYLVKGLGKAVQPMLKSGESFEIKDYELVVDETTGFGKNGSEFTLNRQSNKNLMFNSFKISFANEFVKI